MNKTTVEVHHQEPRHYYESALLLIMVGHVPEEWVVKIDEVSECVVPVCRYDFTDDGRKPERPSPETKPLPPCAIRALRDYDGPYAEGFETVWRFDGPAQTPEELLSEGQDDDENMSIEEDQ